MSAVQDNRKPGHDRGKTTLMCALVFTLSCLYFLSYSSHDMNIWDEGVPLNGAIRMFDGDRPIRDFLAYPPGRYLVYNAAMVLGGKKVTSPRIAMAILSALYAAFVYYMARRTGLVKSAIIPTILFLLMPMYYYYRFFTFCLLIAALAIDLQLKPAASGKLIISGLLAATIIWFRFELGVILLFLLPLMGLYCRYVRKSGSLWKNLLPTLIMLSGVTSEIIYVGGWQIWLDYLNKYLSIARGGIHQMSLPWPPLWSIEYIRSVTVPYFFQDSLHYIFSLVLIIGIYTVFFSRFKGNSTIKSITLMGIIGFGLVVWRTGFGNLIRCAPPLTILTVWLMALPSQYKSSYRMIGYLLLAGISVDSLLTNPSSYQSIGIMHFTSSYLNHPRFPVHLHPDDCRRISELTSTLETLKASGYETMLALPFHPLINYVTDLKNKSYYDWLLPGMFVSSYSYESAILDVITSNPDLVILNDEQFDGIEDRRFSRQFPELMIWLGSRYFLWEQIAGFDVYLKKGVKSKGLIDERTCLPLFESGSNRIEKTDLSSSSVLSLSQTGNSKIIFKCHTFERSRFYSMIFLNDPFGDCSSDCVVRLFVNGFRQMELTLSSSRQYVNLSSAVIDDKNSFAEIELSCEWADPSKDCSVIWIDPGFTVTSLPGFVVDRYCR